MLRSADTIVHGTLLMPRRITVLQRPAQSAPTRAFVVTVVCLGTVRVLAVVVLEVVVGVEFSVT